jgi:hypothetical protein
MQISGVSLTLTWLPAGFVYLEFSWVPPPMLQVFPSPSTLGEVNCTGFLQPTCLFTVHMGSVPSHLSSRVFLTQPLLQAFLLQGCWVGAAAPAFSGQLVYLQFREGLPLPPSVLRAPRPLCYVSFVVVYSVCFLSLFFPGWGSVCLGGYADLAQGCLWEYRVPLSSPGGLRLSSG